MNTSSHSPFTSESALNTLAWVKITLRIPTVKIPTRTLAYGQMLGTLLKLLVPLLLNLTPLVPSHFLHKSPKLLEEERPPPPG